ncbi:MAG: YkgJ family cysteine cluster protein [Planctomycetota bacterium]|nr:MAG: YkgJ family cysteine cluster protein [Planctomycetota bacterium]
MNHPCLTCGACCAFYRVSFHWSEGADVQSDGVPLEHLRDRSAILRDMRGTTDQPPRCSALAGIVGGACRCTIYQQRPSPCRDLQASYENGLPSPGCDRARAAHGLPPLTPEDWQHPPQDAPPPPQAA